MCLNQLWHTQRDDRMMIARDKSPNHLSGIRLWLAEMARGRVRKGIGVRKRRLSLALAEVQGTALASSGIRVE